MAEEKMRFLHEFLDRGADISYYYYQEENLLSSVHYPRMREDVKALLAESFCTQNKRVPFRGRDFGDVKHYDLKALIGDFCKEKLIQTTHNGRLFRAKIGGDDGLGDREVTVKTWDFTFLIDPKYRFYPVRFMNELNLLTMGEMKSHKNLVNVIGYSCEKFLAVVYDLQSKQRVCDAIPSDTFDWNDRMTVAIEIARLVKSMHDKKTAIGTIDARNIMIDKEGNVKLFEIGLHVGQGDTTTTEDSKCYYLESYGYYAPDIYSGTFSIKGDTYAYGILLLELISKQVFDKHKPYDLEKRALDTRAAGKESFVDASFGVDDGVGSKITNLAVSCLDKDPAKRPGMGEVANQLETLYGHLHRPIKKPKTGDNQKSDME